MMDTWYYSKNGQQMGPVATEAIQSLLATGELSAADLLWQDGMPNWLPASSIPAFAAGAAPSYAAAPTGAVYPGQMPGAQTPYGQPPYAQPAQPLNYGGYAPTTAFGPRSYAKDAQAAMIWSIVGIFCCNIILGPVGLVKGLNAKKSMQASQNFEGQGMATAAIIIGIIDIVLFVVGIIIRFALYSAHTRY